MTLYIRMYYLWLCIKQHHDQAAMYISYLDRRIGFYYSCMGCDVTMILVDLIIEESSIPNDAFSCGTGTVPRGESPHVKKHAHFTKNDHTFVCTGKTSAFNLFQLLKPHGQKLHWKLTVKHAKDECTLNLQN